MLLSGSGIFLIQCESGGRTDSGGAGADIDVTSIKQIWYANTTDYEITSMGYSGGPGPWGEASLYAGIVMQINAHNSSAEHRYIQFAYEDPTVGRELFPARRDHIIQRKALDILAGNRVSCVSDRRLNHNSGKL